MAIFLFNKMFVKIDSGHAGLVYHTFGGGIDPSDEPLEQGLKFIAPWNDVIDYEIRRQEVNPKMTVLSSNLLDIDLDVSVFITPIKSSLGNLELEWGKGYMEKTIIPSIRSVTREVMAKYLPEEINTTKRKQIEVELEDVLREKLLANYVNLEDFLIRNIELPAKLRESIEKKLQQEQESLEYEFRIQKATKEAQRKRIEAQGIQDFQNIVAKSITPQLLKWKGIEATETISQSDNAKVIVIGSGSDGLPLILGGN
ncbi:MAG: prohibitin family protein [Flavobacteriales bacterium]|nr:prohibitin family protein [Flavobacteriales bacterium]